MVGIYKTISPAKGRAVKRSAEPGLADPVSPQRTFHGLNQGLAKTLKV